MSRDEVERLRDAQDAIAAIRSHVAKTEEGAASREDPLLHDALLFQFVVIGEAVKHLAPETRESSPEIPWSDIAGLRDMIAHEYFRIDIHRVLVIVERDLPPARAGDRSDAWRLTAKPRAGSARRRSRPPRPARVRLRRGARGRRRSRR
jgi:uncharacterized protein with HEPN domain